MRNKIKRLIGPVQVSLGMEAAFVAIMLPVLWCSGGLEFFWLCLLQFNLVLASLLGAGIVADRIQRPG